MTGLRVAVRAVLFLGIAASVAANVLHADGGAVSRVIAAWSPLALVLTVELIAKVPVRRRVLGAVRIVSTATIATIAAWVSYWHMVGVATRYGETGASAYLLPFSVDGLILVASICLVELGAKTPAPDASGDASETRQISAAPTPVPDASPDAIVAPVDASEPRQKMPRALTAEQRVTAAHRRAPDASTARIAELAKVSPSTARRYRPAASTSAPHAAQTPDLPASETGSDFAAELVGAEL